MVAVLRLAAYSVAPIRSIWAALATNSPALYGTLAGVAGTLVGFIITALSIVVVLGPQPQFHLLRAGGQMRTLVSVFSQAIMWLAATTLWSLLGLFVSVERPVGWVVAAVTLWLTVLTSLRVYRCVWALYHVVDIALLASPGRDHGLQ